MKNLSAITLLLLLVVLFTAGTVFKARRAVNPIAAKENVISCAPSASDKITADENGKFIAVLPGWGDHSYTITTGSDSAQLYFNQGLNLYYGYQFKEAVASFKEAARFDKSNPMVYWGQALAMGPYYNNYYYKMDPGVPAALRFMNSFIANASKKEKALIKAMQCRYSNDITNADRPQLDSAYAAAMSEVIEQFPDDADIKALYVDAVMLQHKWDFWYNNGQPKQWTPEVVKICEEILAKDYNHPAALHYYIHLTEASKHPEVALPGADVLKDAMPGVPHMVHMATHMYQRNGLYAKGVYVNEDANTASNIEDSLAPQLGRGKNTVLHFFAVQSYCAMNAGMYNKALNVYSRTRKRVIDLNGSLEKQLYLQYVYMMPVIAAVRTGQWDQVLATQSPDRSWKYASVLNDFAKGLSYVNRKDVKEAKKCLYSLQRNLRDSLLAVRLMPHNAPLQSCKIAEGILKGEILFEEGKTKEAITSFEQAVEEEDNLIYAEPNNWLIPARQYLGAYLLKLKKLKEAEAVYREDLIWNPGNGWSLLGLHKALLAQRKTGEAQKYKAAFTKAFEDADVSPVTSVF